MGLQGQILNNLKATKVINYTGAGTTTITGSAIDMRGFDSAVFMASVGTYHGTNNYIKVQGGDVAAGTDAADLLGSKVLSETNNGVMAVEIYKPLFRYLFLLVVVGTSSTIGSCYALQSGGHVLPEDNNVAATIVSEIKISPIAGTA